MQDNAQILQQTEAIQDSTANAVECNDIPDDGEKVRQSDAIDADNEACEGKRGETNKDTPKNITIPVFEQVGWKEKVKDFLQRYPIAKDFASQIGKTIVESEELANDENCLEKALASTLAKSYVSREKLAADEEFLQKYILNNQAVKDRIIEEYFEQLEQNRPPKSITSRGQMTLTPPSRPKSIAEAGSLIKAMLTNRRI